MPGVRETLARGRGVGGHGVGLGAMTHGAAAVESWAPPVPSPGREAGPVTEDSLEAKAFCLP